MSGSRCLRAMSATYNDWVLAKRLVRLTRAADVEPSVRRLAYAFNVARERQLADELRRLWSRYAALELAA